MKANSSKYIYYILSFFSFCVIVFFSLYLSKYNLIVFDDATSIFYDRDEGFFRSLIHPYHGKYIADFFIKLSGYLIPYYLQVHPVTWIGTGVWGGGALIKGIFFAILSFLIASCMFIFNKRCIYLPLCAIVIYVLLQIPLVNEYQNEMYTSFYSFIFPFIFFVLFWRRYYNEILINNRKHSKILMLYAFILGTSSDCTAIASFFSLLLFMIMSIIQKLKNIKSDLILFCCLLSGMVVYLLNSEFQNIAKDKGAFPGISEIIGIFPEYISGYINTFTNHFLIYLLIIVILFIFVIKYNKISIKKQFLFFIF